jgi:hypothetical protein
MPKHEIDYSNTIIYKITCNDSTISDLYVGHTTNFIQRKHVHKQSSINEKSPNYKCKLYEVIRNNGGWKNWKMEIINFFNCKNQYEARKKEQEYFLSLNATLNSIEPYAIPKPKDIVIKNTVIKEVLHCKECNKYFNNKDLLETHNQTNKHKNHLDIIITPKTAKYFNCEICIFKCSKLSDWSRHISTSKHLNRIKLNNLEQEHTQTDKFICKICYKSYKARNSLWYHEQKCKPIETPVENIETIIMDPSSNEIKILTTLVLELVKNNTELQKQTTELQKQNQDFQKQMIDVCQKIQPGNTNINSNNNTNNNNKTFNLQFFLNEECKDAMNMSEFINSIELKLSDLENIGKLGYVQGMSNIIIKELNATDMYKRPVHCSDAKRETLYVKEENKWEKEGPDNNKMIKAVHGVDKKNYLMLNKWKESHPKYLDGQSNQCDEYMKLMSKIMDGDKENINKVIKRIAKEVVIDK